MSKDELAKIEKTYKTMCTYTCPVRGIVTQEVVVKRFKAQSAPEHVSIDPEISELLSSVTDENLEDHGFHEEIN